MSIPSSTAPGRTIAGPIPVAPPKATMLQLVFMTYAVICAGAYGLEEMISASGPGLALLLLAVFPFIYAAPIALSCSELASRYPIEGGYYRWVRIAFSDFAAYNVAWLMWLTTFATNASLAVLSASYLRYFVPGLSEAWQFAVSAGLVWMAVFINHRGIQVVGSASTILVAIILIPFAVLTVLGVVGWQHNPVLPFANPHQPFSTALSTGLLMTVWLYGGLERMTVNAGEVANPRRAFPMALGLGLLLCASSYILPTVTALAAGGNWQDWGVSYFTTVAADIGGPWLGGWMATGALLSSACIVMTTTLSHSRLPMVLAQDGLFPSIFRRVHPRFGTPTFSLFITGIGLTSLCVLPFSDLVGMYSAVQSLAYLSIYAALFKLRKAAAPTEPGAFRIPLGTAGLVAMVTPSVLIAGFVIQQSLSTQGTRYGLLLLVILCSSPLTYLVARRRMAGTEIHTPQVREA